MNIKPKNKLFFEIKNNQLISIGYSFHLSYLYQNEKDNVGETIVYFVPLNTEESYFKNYSEITKLSSKNRTLSKDYEKAIKLFFVQYISDLHEELTSKFKNLEVISFKNLEKNNNKFFKLFNMDFINFHLKENNFEMTFLKDRDSFGLVRFSYIKGHINYDIDIIGKWEITDDQKKQTKYKLQLLF